MALAKDPDNEWHCIDVGELMGFLRQELEAGTIDLTTKVYADQDPEGNGFNPLRAAVELGNPLGVGRTEGWVMAEIPADAPVRGICFGVGYES